MFHFHLLRRIALLGIGLLVLLLSVQRTTGKENQSAQSLLTDGAASAQQLNFYYYFPFVTQPSPPTPPSSLPLYGLNFISSAEAPADEQQYQNGMSTGVSWNRWPIYWYSVEKNPDQFDWSVHDTLVIADLNHQFKINAILMGTPGFYTSGFSLAELSTPPRQYNSFSMTAPNATTPQGLYEPVFSDNSDQPGPGKGINANNKWARFVYAAVNRYKPGGVLAQAYGWPAGKGVTHWEMWNEQDYSFFWNSSLADYARLLKVGYLAAKQADSNAQVLFGGLANFQQPNFLRDVLAVYATDPMASQHGYFFDILATHSYSRSWDSWLDVWRAKREMGVRGLDKSVWLNESGVPAWDDYPGPVWDSSSAFRATMSEQADYTIQSAFYATWAGADVIFHFQLYDGCGNQPAGTNPPPSTTGDICDAQGNYNGKPCAGDANGFFRNPSDAICFAQHPQPETARPKLVALQLLTTHLRNVVPLDRKRVGNPDPTLAPQEWISFYRASTNERVMGLWARFGDPQTAVVPATSKAGRATLIAPDGTSQTIVATNGNYSIYLPGATNLNSPWDLRTGYPIGGRPFILIEKMDK